MRLFHCTTVELTSANTPNVGISDVQFLVVGTAFALSRIILLEKIFFFTVLKLFLYILEQKVVIFFHSSLLEFLY